MKAECIAEKLQKSKFLHFSMDKELEQLDYHGCPKFRDLGDAKADEEIWTCLRYSLRHKATLPCAERQAKLVGNWTRHHLRL